MDTDTWFYAKRCFLAFGDNLAKQILSVDDGVYKDILSFLDQCDKFGKGIPTSIMDFSPQELETIEHPTIRHEARLLKAFFLKLRGW